MRVSFSILSISLSFSFLFHTYTHLEAAGTISARDKTRLETLREEVEAIKKAKKEYAAAHPVAESSRAQETLVDIGATKKRSKDPKRSVYYDAVFNPHGTPREQTLIKR